MDQMEVAGIVGATQGGKPRQVLVDPTQLEIILSSL
jgi:DNA segregation ATPase FtsK/SpoIIIE-like protein